MDAIVYAGFHISLQVLYQPFAEYFPVFGQYVRLVVFEQDFLLLFGTHHAGVSGVAEGFLAGVVLPSADEGGFLYFVEFAIRLFQFQFALASLGDVTVLAEHHIFVGAHDALEEVGGVADGQLVVPAGDFPARKYFLELGVYLPVGDWGKQPEYVLAQQPVFFQEPHVYVVHCDIHADAVPVQ